MAYQVVLPRVVQKQLGSLPPATRIRITSHIIMLKENPRPSGCVKLKSYENEYRIRIGDYRVRYEIRDEASPVIVLQCKHRKEIYNKD